MQEYRYLIVGGGLAAASAVDGIREVDSGGTILVLTDEATPPYHRPPLSKEYLQAPEAPRDLLHVKPAGWFDDQEGLTLRLEDAVVSLDPRMLTVTVESGEVFRGERILLATGGRPRTLSIPGTRLERVFTLRTVEDAEAIRDAAREAESALLIGAGFVGMELAASLRTFDVDSLVVERQESVWPAMLPESISGFMQAYFEERGVKFRLGARVEELRGGEQVESAILDTGEEIGCDLVVQGVGLVPNVELASAAEMAVQDGIVVDPYSETSHGHIYAAGDVARFADPISGESIRVEHWDHAKAHGKLAGRNMAGEREAYDHLSYFFTNAFDLSINVFGRPAISDQSIVSGVLGSARSIVYCASEGRLCGTILINANDALDECRNLVRIGPSIEEIRERLARFEEPDAEVEELVG
jgi:3-phenylpropionate/trans-cinnamate dioxygenase ferredoxin reductase subunit